MNANTQQVSPTIYTDVREADDAVRHGRTYDALTPDQAQAAGYSPDGLGGQCVIVAISAGRYDIWFN